MWKTVLCANKGEGNAITLHYKYKIELKSENLSSAVAESSMQCEWTFQMIISDWILVT